MRAIRSVLILSCVAVGASASMRAQELVERAPCIAVYQETRQASDRVAQLLPVASSDRLPLVELSSALRQAISTIYDANGEGIRAFCTPVRLASVGRTGVALRAKIPDLESAAEEAYERQLGDRLAKALSDVDGWVSTR
jgi:hypothetical protein